jgi:hypothetical protein
VKRHDDDDNPYRILFNYQSLSSGSVLHEESQMNINFASRMKSAIRRLEGNATDSDDIVEFRSLAIHKGDFCDCDDGRKARNYPDGTKVKATAMLCFHHADPNRPDFLNFLYLKDDGRLYVAYDFMINTEQNGLQWILMEFPLERNSGASAGGGDLSGLRQMLNSAANTYSWDTSDGAAQERKSACYDEHLLLDVINDLPVVVELGVAPGEDCYNFVKRILQPDDPEYIDVMGLEDYGLAGTGMDGGHTPPPQRT